MFGISNLLLYGLVALAILGAVGAGVYKVKEWGADEVRSEWAEANRVQREKEQKQAQGAAEKKEQGDAKARVVYAQITREVERVVEKPIYHHVCLDPDGMRVARDAILGKITDPAKPDESVPPAP